MPMQLYPLAALKEQIDQFQTAGMYVLQGEYDTSIHIMRTANMPGYVQTVLSQEKRIGGQFQRRALVFLTWELLLANIPAANEIKWYIL